MERHRTAGVELPIESLPGPFGTGDLGLVARKFVDFLADAGQSWWYIPTISPRSSLNELSYSTSIDAGNPYIICLDRLSRDNAMRGFDSISTPDFRGNNVDTARIRFWFDLVFKEAFRGFDEQLSEKGDFSEYCERHKEWLEEFAHFQALRRYHRGQPWWTWPEEVARRTPQGLETSRKYLRHEITREKFVQFSFDLHWRNLKEYARSRGVGLIGVLPSVLMNDSVDVWAQPSLFEVDVADLVDSHVRYSQWDVGNEKASPTQVRPRWDLHRANGFAWWSNRFRRGWEHFDALRFDDLFVSPAASANDITAARTIADAIGDAAHREFFESLSAEFGELKALRKDHEVSLSALATDNRHGIDDAWAGGASIALASFQSVQRIGDGLEEAQSNDGECFIHRRIDSATFGPLLAQRLANLTSQYQRNPR